MLNQEKDVEAADSADPEEPPMSGGKELSSSSCSSYCGTRMLNHFLFRNGKKFKNSGAKWLPNCEGSVCKFWILMMMRQVSCLWFCACLVCARLTIRTWEEYAFFFFWGRSNHKRHGEERGPVLNSAYVQTVFNSFVCMVFSWSYLGGAPAC